MVDSFETRIERYRLFEREYTISISLDIIKDIANYITEEYYMGFMSYNLRMRFIQRCPSIVQELIEFSIRIKPNTALFR